MEKVAVVGASPKEERYSNKAMKMLAGHGHTPIPVAPAHETIEGKKVFSSLGEIQEKIDTVSLYLGPARQETVVEEILKIKPGRVIFNPDTENRAAAERLKQAGIEVVEACTLVLLKTNQF
ncbi:CoA-binding protein [Desulfospira joergensenii]|uniref:CoA-binding protein n=1 Tax=Desulfospira joergensenii TaxID=53329 RepID=UPI0003B38C5C|nr:CoA-binding protein [Desulfospira joergensenii]